ncbi:MAG: PP2C family protein-serine/threonine phosphatase, partial [Balneolaceae bacterium]
RGILFLIFFVWILSQLYIRIKLRVVDTKTAILFAVLAGLFIPILNLLEWAYANINTIQKPGVFDFFLQLIEMGFMAAFLSMAFFMITAIGDSIIRQHWIEKIRTIDLIRIGHLFNLPVGLAFIRSVSYGFIIAALFSLLFLILPGSFLTVAQSFNSDTTYLAPISEILMVLFISFAVVQTILMILMGRLSGTYKSTFVIAVSAGVIFALMSPVQFGFGPLHIEMLLLFLIGAVFGIIFVKTDGLTTLLTYFMFVLIIRTSDGWVLSHSPDTASFYSVLLIIVAFIIIGYIGIYKGKSIRELPRYVPGYIDDLAQEERIKQELKIARGVQESFLPVRTPKIQKLDLAGICIPAYETGGDYYDFIPMNDDKLAVAIGDVSGKGIQAAFYMTFIKGVLHALCKENETSLSLLSRVNELFTNNAPRGTFISLIFGVLNSRTGEFVFSRAGHNPLFHYRARYNKVEMIRPDGIGIGMTDQETFIKNIKEAKLKLEKGDILVLFTDGITEANNLEGEQYGDKRLSKFMESCKKETSKEIMYKIIDDVKTYSKDTQQHDDMTLVVIKME